MNNFDIDIARAKALTTEDRSAWLDLRADNPALYSPYFHPDYAMLVGELRNDAYIAIARKQGTPVAFLPYQGPKPGKSHFARPIGAPMTDYHGIIHAADMALDPVAFLAQTGIGAFHYWALVGDHQNPIPGQKRDEACAMTLPEGPEQWRNGRDSSYRRHLKSHRRRVRKAEETFGPRRFEFSSPDDHVFNTLIQWKKQKFAETGKYDVLGAGWTHELIETLWRRQSPDLRCEMHALYFGEELAAIDLGLTDGVTFHSWIVSYNGDFHSYAPGIQLLEGLIDASPDRGYQRIDLGVGLDGYKRHYATEDIQVSQGFIAVRGPAAALSQIYGAAERLGEKALKDAPGKLRRRYSQIAACDDSFSGRAKAMLEAVKTSGQN